VTDPARTTAVVLAAGAGTRFGGGKLSATLGDRRIIDHVLDTLAEVGFVETIVVVGPGPDAPSLPSGDVRVVVNPRPADGLSSSLRIGLAALAPSAQAVLLVLGDQPFIRPTTVRALLEADVPAGRSVVVPRYAADSGSNPVLLLRDGWALAAAVEGDRGLGSAIANHPELVVEVTVNGSNPDIDTRADLAVAAWSAQVRANREQVDRVREVGDGDFYASTSSLFVADPRRADADDPTLAALRGLVQPGERWLDIGAGAGRYALPIALAVGPAGEVVAVEASASMLAGLRAGMADHGIANVRIVEGRWPAVAAEIRASLKDGARPPVDGARPPVDATLIAHVGYDIEEIGPFLDAMEAAADRLCVAILMDRTPRRSGRSSTARSGSRCRRSTPSSGCSGLAVGSRRSESSSGPCAGTPTGLRRWHCCVARRGSNPMERAISNSRPRSTNASRPSRMGRSRSPARPVSGWASSPGGQAELEAATPTLVHLSHHTARCRERSGGGRPRYAPPSHAGSDVSGMSPTVTEDAPPAVTTTLTVPV